MDELTKRDQLMQIITAVELEPSAVEHEITLQNSAKLPLSKISTLGVGLEPIVAAIQQITSKGQATSGYYKVTIPPGTHLAQFKNSSDYFGAALSDSTNILQNQAHLTPLQCNPTLLFVTAALTNIDQKLDKIQETQQKMLDFIVQKEKSNLKGDMDFLTDVFNNYKLNWNNEKYKSANHIKVLDIRQNANRMIDFYREQIKRHLRKKSWLHSDQDVRKQRIQIQDDFKEYQLALYLYGFAYFLEVLLQENFEATYLNAITSKIDTLSFQYREMYSAAYTQIEEQTKSSLQSRILGGLSIANKTAGETIAKIPIISRSPIDETLIATGEKLESYEENRTKASMQTLVGRQNSCVQPFIDQIHTVSRIYNQPMTLVFNEETIYLGSSSTLQKRQE